LCRKQFRYYHSILGDDTGTAAGDKEDIEISEDMTEDEEDDVMVTTL